MPAHTEIYTLSLHDALPICEQDRERVRAEQPRGVDAAERAPEADERADHGRDGLARARRRRHRVRSEEHTSELQSRRELVCRLLLEKKKKSARGSCPRRSSP